MIASERWKKKQQQHAQHLLKVTFNCGHLHDHLFFFFFVFLLSFSLSFIFGMFVFILQNFLCLFLFLLFVVFLRSHFASMELFGCVVFFETTSLTYHANSRPPTKQIQIKPFSNIQMHIIFSRHIALHCMQRHSTAHQSTTYVCKQCTE